MGQVESGWHYRPVCRECDVQISACIAEDGNCLMVWEESVFLSFQTKHCNVELNVGCSEYQFIVIKDPRNFCRLVCVKILKGTNFS